MAWSEAIVSFPSRDAGGLKVPVTNTQYEYPLGGGSSPHLESSYELAFMYICGNFHEAREVLNTEGRPGARCDRTGKPFSSIHAGARSLCVIVGG